jgi:hypothetical protein
MSRPEHSEIWKERHRLDKERRDFMAQAMVEFDKKHSEKLAALRARCEKIGHVRGNFHDNGIGWTWHYCNQCGAAFGRERYETLV